MKKNNAGEQHYHNLTHPVRAPVSDDMALTLPGMAGERPTFFQIRVSNMFRENMSVRLQLLDDSKIEFCILSPTPDAPSKVDVTRHLLSSALVNRGTSACRLL